MQTRSQTFYDKSVLYTVVIDFDEASKEWNSNKRKIENGCYKYVCKHICKSGEYCKREPRLGNEFCSTHLTKGHS